MATDNAYKPKSPSPPTEIKIISRNNLFYWWPVWAVGFVMTAITWWSGYHMVAVPERAEIIPNAMVISEMKEKGKGTVVLIKDAETKDPSELKELGPHISPQKNLGVIFAIVLVLVIAITNVHMRGLWSVIVVVVLLSLIAILSAYGAWDPIVRFFFFLDIRINAGGYFFISTVLFVLWLVVYLLYDTQVYMVFTPGSFRVRLEIGEGETAYDTRGMTIQKVRSDFFRHWILGLGSGDMIVRTSGADAKEFHLTNVLFLSRKVKIIEEMLRTQVVTATQHHN